MDEHHQVVIAAAVTAMLGKHARVRQIRAINHPVSSRWARQGRIVVQTSHNFPMQRGWGRVPKREPRS
jgi:hypothetical protein